MTKSKEMWILYQTTNLINKKIYVGVHKCNNTVISKCYLGSGKALKPAIKKYGRENFTRVTLAEFNCGGEAYLAETVMVNEEFIKRSDTYNMKIGGLGCIATSEIRAKQSAAAKGRKHTEETKAKLSVAQTGRKHSEEHKSKVRAFQTGRVRSEETKAKMSASQKGKVISEEQKVKLIAANIGKTHTEETKAKMRAASHYSKPVMIKSKYYTSITLAAQAEKVSFKAVQWRLRSSIPKWFEWRYATEEETASFLLMVNLGE